MPRRKGTRKQPYRSGVIIILVHPVDAYFLQLMKLKKYARLRAVISGQFSIDTQN